MNIESIRKIIFETQDTPISAQDVINLLNQRISDLNDANKEQTFIKSSLKDKLLWITNGFANPSNKTINANATFPDSVSCYAFVKDTSFALRIRFSNHYNKKVRHNIRARQAQASTQATEIISFVFDSYPDKVDVRQPIDGIPFSIININERHLSKKDDVILYIKSLIDLIKSQKYKMPFVTKATSKTEHKNDKYSIYDYINEQKYQTKYKMKSLQQYISEAISRYSTQEITKAKKYLETHIKDFELDGCEISEEDAINMLNLINKEGKTKEDAMKEILKGIRDTLD